MSLFYSEMCDYVYFNQYNSLFCELIPSIMANVINHIIIVINAAHGAPVTTYEFIPEEYENRKPICKKCNLKLGVIVLLRRSHHYDACVQQSTRTDPYSCDVSSSLFPKDTKRSDVK